MADSIEHENYQENVENFNVLNKSLDIEKSITKEIKEREGFLSQCGHLNKSVEESIRKQIKLADIQMSQLTTYNKDLAKAYGNLASLNAGQDRKSAQLQVQSAKDHINNIISQITNSQLKWQKDSRILDETKAKHDFITKSIQDRLGIEIKEISNIKKTNEEISKLFPELSVFKVGMLSGLMALTQFARGMYESFEKSAFTFRKFAGMFRNQAEPIRQMTEDITIQFANVGVTLEGAYTSVKSLGSEMGGLHNVTKDLVVTTSLLSAQLGVSEENTAGMLRNLAIASKSTMQAQKSMAYFTADLSAAAGVPLNLVMRDIAKMSGTTFAMISKMPLAIIKSAVEARKLNTTLNDMAKASRSILDFQNSVNAEMEASVLIGSSINLQRARLLAYQKDLVGSTKEILNIAKRIDFQNLDVFQMEAFAHATGRSVEELTKMLQAEQQMEEARRDPNLAKQVADYDRLKAANEAIAKDSASNLETMIMQKANQERMVALQNQWNKMLMQASRIFLPIIDFAMKLAGIIMSLYPLFSGIWGIASGMVSILSKVGGSMELIWNASKHVFVAATFVGKLYKGFQSIAAILGKILTVGGIFGKWVPILGWVITAFQLISSSVKNIGSFLKGDISFGTALWNIVKEVLLQPFIDAWNWIKSIFVGGSPSQLAMGIVRGLLSAGAMIYDALTYPFRHAFAWIMDKIPGMGDIAKKLRGGMGDAVEKLRGGLLEEPVEKKAMAAYVPAIQVTPTGVTVAGKETKPDLERKEEKDKTTHSLDDIYDILNQVNSNLVGGKVKSGDIYLDGSMISTFLARSLEFKGAFGSNR